MTSSCISPYDNESIGAYSISISTSLRKEAFELRLDLILHQTVRRQSLGLDQNFKNHYIHLTLRRKAHRCRYTVLQQMTPRSRAKPHCMHLFANGVTVWILGSWLDKTGVSLVFRHSSLKAILSKDGATINTPFCTY